LHALFTGQTQFNVDETVELRIVDAGHTVTLRPLGPTEIGANRIQDTDGKRRNTQRGRSELGISREQTGRAGVQEGNCTGSHNDGKINIDLPATEDALGFLVHDSKTVGLFTSLGEVVL